jgi:hypothetical protein
MPNAIAMGMLALWPLVTALLFQRLPAPRALIAALLAGYLFLPPLPAAFDFPLMPPFSKETIPSLAALIMCLVLYRPGAALLPQGVFARALILVFIISPLGTVLTNPEPVVAGPLVLPGLRLRESVGMMVGQAILIAPLLMARHFLSQADHHRDILWALLIAGLVYSPLMLLEVRLSPQLNIWIYGYFQHLFEQMIRGDGFRPIVFLQHGLWVAFFGMTAAMAGLALARTERSRHSLLLLVAGAYLIGVVILCKSLGAMIYAVALIPVILLLGTMMQVRLAALLAFLALVYPLAKGAHVVPDDQILAYARSIDAERAHSLEFRFDMETVLLARAEQKPVFGWGIWGRHHEFDPQSGQRLTITDGRWIVVIGTLGWVGFLAEFGLLIWPMLLLWWRTRAQGQVVPPVTGMLAVLLGVNIFDLIPNATITPLTWLIAGAILGLAENHVRVPQPRPAPLQTVL